MNFITLKLKHEHRYGQQVPQSKDNPFINSIQDDNIQEEEVITKLVRIIEDLEDSIVDPTLGLDVALDMDNMTIGQIAWVKEVRACSAAREFQTCEFVYVRIQQ